MDETTEYTFAITSLDSRGETHTDVIMLTGATVYGQKAALLEALEGCLSSFTSVATLTVQLVGRVLTKSVKT